MLKEGQYELADGRVIWEPTKMYVDHYDCIADMPNMALSDVEYYADYFGWYYDNKMYGPAKKIGEITGRLADAAHAELARRGVTPTRERGPTKD